MVEELHWQVAGRRRVGDHDVERVGDELADELLRVVLAADEPNRLRLLYGRPQQSIDEQLWHRVRDPDGQLNIAPWRSPLERLEQLTSDAEDLVGIAMNDAADIGEHLGAPLPGEQRLAERLLQHPHLRADGWLR